MAGLAIKKEPRENWIPCFCEEVRGDSFVKNGIDVVKCSSCGVIRQINLPFSTREDLYKYYETEYTLNKLHTYSHDYKIAKDRVDRYNVLFPGVFRGRGLDIGAGNSAFVKLLGESRIDCVGCEPRLKEDQAHTYKGPFEEIHYPTDRFNFITCHDVIEHTYDPQFFLQEIFRTLKPGGMFIMDMPAFFDGKAGVHHWKKVEHIWYFSIQQIEQLLQMVGFKIILKDRPIEGKVVFYCSKDEQDRLKILLPPGIGDTYWSIVKLESFLRNQGVSIADAGIACEPDADGRHSRSFDFISKFPFLNASGDVVSRTKNAKIWKEAYMQAGRTIFKRVANYDYFMAYNGVMRHGKSLYEVDRDLAVEWYPDMYKSLEARIAERVYRKSFGERYIVFYFVSAGMYKKWLAQYPVEQLAYCINEVCRQTGCIAILAGAKWDVSDPVVKRLNSSCANMINLTGTTSFDQLEGLIRGAQAVVGYPSGLTIISTIYKTQTVMLWNNYFNRKFWKNACPPDSLGNWYHFVDTYQLKDEHLISMIIRAVGGLT